MLKMKNIALDFDGVIADTNKEKIKWMKEKGLNARNVDKTSFYSELKEKLTKNEIEQLYKEMSKNIFLPEILERTQPVQGAIETIKKISEKFDIYIITARTEKLIEPIYEWLGKYDINKNIKKIISSSYELKQDICLKNNISFLCDDDIRHLIDKKIQLRVLLSTNKEKSYDDIIIAKSWCKIGKILELTSGIQIQ